MEGEKFFYAIHFFFFFKVFSHFIYRKKYYGVFIVVTVIVFKRNLFRYIAHRIIGTITLCEINSREHLFPN